MIQGLWSRHRFYFSVGIFWVVFPCFSMLFATWDSKTFAPLESQVEKTLEKPPRKFLENTDEKAWKYVSSKRVPGEKHRAGEWTSEQQWRVWATKLNLPRGVIRPPLAWRIQGARTQAKQQSTIFQTDGQTNGQTTRRSDGQTVPLHRSKLKISQNFDNYFSNFWQMLTNSNRENV